MSLALWRVPCRPARSKLLNSEFRSHLPARALPSFRCPGAPSCPYPAHEFRSRVSDLRGVYGLPMLVRRGTSAYPHMRLDEGCKARLMSVVNMQKGVHGCSQMRWREDKRVSPDTFCLRVCPIAVSTSDHVIAHVSDPEKHSVQSRQTRKNQEKNTCEAPSHTSRSLSSAFRTSDGTRGAWDVLAS